MEFGWHELHAFQCMKCCIISIGRGKTMVEFFSAAMVLRVWRYLSWRAEGESAITREASFRALEAFISPSAAMIWNIGRRTVSSDVSFLGLNTWKGNWIQSSIPLITLALASRLASASAAMARCSCWGNFTSLISTRSTLIPHGWVASSRASCRVTSNIKHSSHSYSLINNKSNTLYSTVRVVRVSFLWPKKSVLWMAGGNEGALKVSVIMLFLPFTKFTFTFIYKHTL